MRDLLPSGQLRGDIVAIIPGPIGRRITVLIRATLLHQHVNHVCARRVHLSVVCLAFNCLFQHGFPKQPRFLGVSWRECSCYCQCLRLCLWCVTRAGHRTSVVRVGFRRRPHFLQDFIDRLKNQHHSYSPSANNSETARFAWLESGEPHIRDERPQEAIGVHRQAISEVLSHARTFSQGLT